jgi:cell division protein FtsB
MERSVAHRVYELTEEALAAENASLREDVESYSTLAKVALSHVAALTRRNDQLQEQNRTLRNDISDLHDELKALREFLMERDRAA